LKRIETSNGLSSQVEPVLTTVSRDAVLWDLNEVLKHNMQLRNRTDFKASAKGGTQSSVRSPKPEDFPHIVRQFCHELPGVTCARLKKEVVRLDEATKEDVQNGKNEASKKTDVLIQQRLRDQCLDGLLALQVVWRMRTNSSLVEDKLETGSDVPAPAPQPMPKPKPKPGRKPSPPPTTDAASHESTAATSGESGKSRKKASRFVDVFLHRRRHKHRTLAQSDGEDDEEWADKLAKSLQATSATLEKRSEEIREQQKALGKGNGNMAINMNLDKGTIEFKVLDGASALQDLAKSFGKDNPDDTDGSASDSFSEVAGTQEEMVRKMAQMVSHAFASAQGDASESSGESGESTFDTAGLEEKMKEMTNMLHENIQDAFKSHFAKKQGEDDDEEDDGTKKKPDTKIQMHVIKMDENGANGGLAEMLRSMMAEHGQDGQAAGIDASIEAVDAQELFENAGFNAQSMEDVLKAMFGQAMQQGRKSADADDSSEESSDTIEIL